jgi:hypothetical protein
LHLGKDFRVQVVPVGELAAVQLRQHASLDQVGQRITADHHHVVAGMADHEFALHHVDAVEGVQHHGNAGFLLEGTGCFRLDEVVPVVEVHAGGFRRGHTAHHPQQQGQTEFH